VPRRSVSPDRHSWGSITLRSFPLPCSRSPSRGPLPSCRWAQPASRLALAPPASGPCSTRKSVGG
jgi:hypothetical protein